MNIVYEDEQILVCFKESGLPVESARLGQQSLMGMVLTALRERNPEAEMPYLAMIHRLDQPVQGLGVFAQTPSSAADLSKQLQNHRMQKIYRAIVCGQSPDEGPNEGSNESPDHQEEPWILLEHDLLRDGRTNCSRVVAKGTKGARHARLEYQILDKKKAGAGNLQLLQIRLHTGRHHQIRVQLSASHLPILGDRKYGQGQVQEQSYPGLALCAFSLKLQHPLTKKTMTFSLDERDYTLEQFGGMTIGCH